MIQDLHSHTYYSFCGADTPEAVVETAIRGGIQLLGITDHCYGVGDGSVEIFGILSPDHPGGYERGVHRYFDHINLIKEKYADQIRVLRGIEVATYACGRYALPANVDISFFDYCLIEHIDSAETISDGDLFAFAKRCGCPAGVAHTDLFAHIEKNGEDPLSYFSRMAEQNIFWEMNVNLDSIHQGREHSYMLTFFENKEQQEIIRKSGVKLSVGFDGHRVFDYKPDRIAYYCNRIQEMGIPMAFE